MIVIPALYLKYGIAEAGKKSAEFPPEGDLISAGD
jgi:hypothetical protein